MQIDGLTSVQLEEMKRVVDIVQSATLASAVRQITNIILAISAVLQILITSAILEAIRVIVIVVVAAAVVAISTVLKIRTVRRSRRR
jgi:hypothetical protein